MIAVTAENAEYQIIRALKLNRAKRNQTGEVFIEGTEGIKQAHSAGLKFTRIISVIDGDGDGPLSGWAKALITSHGETRIIGMPQGLYRALCDRENPSELLACVEMRPAKLDALRLPPNPFILAFDRPGDFGNLGSAIRSANAFGVDAVFIIGHGVDIFEPKVIRASLGSVFHTPAVYIESMAMLQDFIRGQKEKNGLLVAGTDSTGAITLPEWKQIHADRLKPLLLVIGNEARGMSIALKALCDEVISIPIIGQVNSLNAACAASILLWEVFKERAGSNSHFS
ncbi:rRNA methyltransferase [Spirochaetia bacterium]|nr:rRNA methyltransferase [Spirochaetia bacterium]